MSVGGWLVSHLFLRSYSTVSCHNVHPILFSFIRLAGIALIVTFILPYVSPSQQLVSKYEVKKVHSYFNQIPQNMPQFWLLGLIPSYKLRIVASIFTFHWIKITWTIHNKDMCEYVPAQNVPNSKKKVSLQHFFSKC